MTLTEFNRNPSRATRLAEQEDVIVERHGMGAFRLSKIEPQPRTVEALLAAGKAIPARQKMDISRMVPNVEIDPAIDIYADMRAHRDRF